MVLEKWLKPEAPEQNAGDASAEAPLEKTSSPKGTPLLFEKATLLDNIGGDEDIAQSILKDALTEFPQHVKMLQQYSQGDDTQAIRFQAHTIKGMAANLCTPALRDIAHKIETASKNSDLSSARALLPELVQTTRMTLDAIRRLI